MPRAKDAFFFTSAVASGAPPPTRPSRFVGGALGRHPERLSARLGAWDELQRCQAPPEEGAAPLPAPSADGVPTVSYSHIEDCRRCPLLYRFKHVLQIPVLPTPPMIYGLALHEAVRDYLRRKREGETPTLEDLQATFKAAWLAEGFISPEHESERFTAGLEALRRFHEQERGMPAADLVEQRFSFMLGQDRVVGRWDRVDRTPEGAVVIDYKTTALEADGGEAAQRKASQDLQLLVYALAYERMYGERPAKVALHFLETGERGEVEPKEEAVSAVRAQITSHAQRIRDRHFPAEPLKPELRTCRACP